MERRAFLRFTERIAAGVLCAGFPASLVGCSGLRYVSAERDGSRLIVRRDDFGAGSYVLVEHPQIPRAVFVHRLPDNTFSAVLTRCTHRGCQVEPVGDRLQCPCHGSQYELSGDVVRGPAERPLHRYAVTADSDRIFIHLSDMP